MSKTKLSSFALSDAGLSSTSIFVFDWVDEEAALDLGRRIASQAGRAITVHDAQGVPLVTFEGAAKN